MRPKYSGREAIDRKILMQQGRNAVYRTVLLGLFVVVLAIGIVSAPQLAKLVSAATTQNGVMTGTYFDHAVIVVMEDHGIVDICAQNPPPCASANGAPYMASLANSYAIGTQYLGINHFSEANYRALLGGDTFGCSNSGCPPVSNPNLVDRLESAGLTWKGYLENQTLASGCDTTYHEPYTPEHNPFVGFTDILNNPARCSKVVLANPNGCTVTDCALVNDLNSASAPNLMWLTPNNCNNMHGFTGICPTSIPMGDNYLKSLVPNILNSQAFTTQRSALFIVFDEGNGYCPLNGSSEDCVYAVWAGPLAKTSYATSNPYNHYSWTRTIEANWNLASLTSNDANAKPMTEFFGSTTPPVILSTSFTYNPSSPQVTQQVSFTESLSNPIVGQTVSFTGSASGGTSPYSYAWDFADSATGSGSSASHVYQAAGTYTVVLTVTDVKGLFATANSTVTVTSPLSASFTYSPSNPAALSNVQFTASATGGTSPYSYTWDFGDGTTNSGASVGHSYLLPGTYTVTLTVVDANGLTTTASTTITVAISVGL